MLSYFHQRYQRKNLSAHAHCLKITQNVAFEFWHFSPIFVLLKLTCLVTLFDRNLQIFQKLAKMDRLNVNVTRFARNVEWYFFSVIFKYSVEKIWIDFLLLLQNSKSFPWLLWPLCVLSEVDALDMRPKSAWALSFKKSLLVSMGPSVVVVLEEFKNFLLLLFNRNSRRHFIPVWHDLFISYVISVLGGPWRWSGLLSQ